MTAPKTDPATLTVNEAATLRAVWKTGVDPLEEVDSKHLSKTAVEGTGASVHSVRGYLGSLVRKGYLTRHDYTEEDRSAYSLAQTGIDWARERGLLPAEETPEEPVNVQRPPAPGPVALDETLDQGRQHWDEPARKAHASPALDLEFQEILAEEYRAADRLFEHARKLSAAGFEVPQELVRAILSARDTTKALEELDRKSR